MVTPYAHEIEQSLLGACINEYENLQDTVDLIEPEHFYLERNRKIYEALVKIDDNNVMLLEQELKDRGQLDEVGRDYLYDLMSVAGFRVPEFCQILIEKKLHRDVIQSAQKVLKNSQNTEDVYSLVDEFNSLAGEIGIDTGEKKSLTPAEIKERDKNNPKAEKLWFGLSDLDHGIFGDSFRRGQVVLTMADSGHGKTVFSRMLAKMLLDQGRYCHWFQLEGYDSETSEDIGQVDNHENIVICDSLDDIEDIKREARRVDRERKKNGIENGTDYFVFDYVQNIECSQKISKTEKVEYISRQITKLAKDLNAVSNPLSQVTIDSTRTGWQQEPRYNDVRWSKQLKQDASTMISIFRPSRIESLVIDAGSVKDWNDNSIPFDSVFAKQVKVRHGKQEHKRLHMIHQDDGLKPYSKNKSAPF